MIDLDAVRKLRVQDGDLLVVPPYTETECMEQLIEALRYLLPDGKVVIVRGPMQQLDANAMNQLGWYRT